MGDHAMLRAPAARRERPARRVHARATTRSRAGHRDGGLFPFTKAFAARRGQAARRRTPRAAPMTIAEKILAAHVVGARRAGLREAGRRGLRARRRRLLPRVHDRPGRTTSSTRSTAPDYRLQNPAKFAVFEDHLIYADGVAPMAPFSPKIQDAARHAARVPAPDRRARLLGARRRLARHLPPGRARAVIEPGDFIQATDSHTCMGGAQQRARVGRRAPPSTRRWCTRASRRRGARSRSASS